jgi:hypothetical protein
MFCSLFPAAVNGHIQSSWVECRMSTVECHRVVESICSVVDPWIDVDRCRAFSLSKNTVRLQHTSCNPFVHRDSYRGLVFQRPRLVNVGCTFRYSQRMLQLSLLMDQANKSKSTRPLLLARAAKKITISASFVFLWIEDSSSLATRLLPVKALAII